jgi:hypothetical protein
MVNSKWTGNLLALAMGCAVSIAGLLALQWFLGRSAHQQHYATQRDEVSQPFYDPNHPDLGWRLLPNVNSHVVRYFGENLAYDYVLRTDQFARRLAWSATVRADQESAKRFLIWLGGSFMFGEGLPDEQTLDYQVSQKLATFRTYNYAVPGYGLANVLAQAESVPFKDQVPERRGVVLYLFPGFHVDRMVGGLQSIDWIGLIPHFRREGNQLVRDGFLQVKHPIRTWLKRFYNKTFLRQKFQLSWPFHINDEDLQTACLAIAQVRDRVTAHFDSAQFFLVLHPFTETVDVTGCLAQYSVATIDLRQTFVGVPDHELKIPYDGHPSAKANQLLAEKIAEFLNQQPQ